MEICSNVNKLQAETELSFVNKIYNKVIELSDDANNLTQTLMHIKQLTNKL